MAKPSIGASLKLDGEREFKQAISEITAGLKVNKSEMELLVAQYKKGENSIEALTAKNNLLENQINSQTDKVKTLEQALKASADKYGESSKKTMEWQVSLNKAKAELINLTDAQEENRQELTKAESSMSNYSQELDKTGQDTNKFGGISSKIFSKLGIDVGDAEQSASGSLMDYISQLTSTGDKSGAVSNIIGDALSSAPVAGAMAAAAAIWKIAEAAQKTADEVEMSTARMQVSLGFTDDEAKAAALSVDNIYKKGLAENKGEAEQALVAVTKLMKLQGEEAENISNQVIALNRTYSQYGVDIDSVTRTASTMMQQFGIDGQQALDLIAAGLQTTANKNRDLLDVLNQYSTSFDRIGYSAEEFLTMLVSAGDAGAFSIDKAAEIIAEFYNQAASGSQDFADGLKELGLSSQGMIKQVTSGGETAQMAFEKIAAKLENVSDKEKQAAIASKLLGSQWEEVGTKATLAMTSAENGIISATGSAQAAVERLSDTNEVYNDKISRGVMSNWEKALGIISDTSKEGGEAAGKASSDGYNKTWQSGEKQILDSVKKTANSANDILSAIGSNGKSNSNSSRLPSYALGTSYHTGGFARVNDRQNDPNSGEIIDLPTGSRVYPNGTLPNSGGDVFNITIDAKNVREFNDIVDMAQKARQQRRAR